MPPIIATIICLLFILYLFYVDFRDRHRSSWELWIPLIWMFLAGSRFVSQWLNLGERYTSPVAYQDGSPLDAFIFSILIFAGFSILVRRRVNFLEVLFKNYWVWLFFIFAALSVVWSDFPFIAFKRWFKAFGNVVMVLVILSEERPYEAVKMILRRLAFLLLPLSVLFLKYYPELGRVYTRSQVMFTGVASQKNGLGQICLISGIYFSWSFLYRNHSAPSTTDHLKLLMHFLLVAMTAWLLFMANSATSLLCLVVAIGIFFLSRVPVIAREPGRIMVVGGFLVFLFGMLEIMIGVSDSVISMLGRDPTLTTRVPMWYGLLEMAEDPLVGVGYESFWLGDRLLLLLNMYGGLHQAHNGYLETYLNLGLIGLFLLLGSIASGIIKTRRYLTVDYSAAILRLCFVSVTVLYNWTEAAFVGVSDMWMLTFLGIMDPLSRQDTESEPD